MSSSEMPSAAPDSGSDEPETEVFYTFTWAPRRQGRSGRRDGPRRDGERQGSRPPRKGKPKGKAGDKPRGPQSYEAKPKREAKVDPDNPFAALAALKEK